MLVEFSCPNFCRRQIPEYIQNVAHPIWTEEGSKRVIPRKDVPSEGLNDLTINVVSQTQKNEILYHEQDWQA